MKKEEPRFVPGDRPECVDSSGTPHLVEGCSYTVRSLKRMSCCGAIAIDVGFKTKDNNGSGLFQDVCPCGKKGKATTDNTAWKLQSRFAFPEEVQEADEAIRQLQNENLKV